MALEIAFAERSDRQLCENEAIAERKLGDKVADKLKRRLADLRAATSVKDIVAGKPQVLLGKYKHQIAVELCDGYHLVFCANHNTNPLLKSDEIDWSCVSRIKILRIEILHG
jgi:proteic killer suppression protein